MDKDIKSYVKSLVGNKQNFLVIQNFISIYHLIRIEIYFDVTICLIYT